MELLQTTIVNLRTWTGLSATVVEKRVFRIKNGRWTLWSAGEGGFGDAVGEKLADLTMGEVRAPERVGGSSGSSEWGWGTEVVQRVGLNGGPWRDGRGAHALAVCVWVGRRVGWTAMHLVERVGGSEFCSDEFWPVGEGQGGGGGA